MSQYPAKPKNRTSTFVDQRAPTATSANCGAEPAGQPPPRRWLHPAFTRFVNSERMRDLVSFQVSLVVHCGLMLLLALLMFDPEQAEQQRTLLVGPEPTQNDELELLDGELSADLLTDPERTFAPEASPPSSPEVPVPALPRSPGGVTTRASEQVDLLPADSLMLVNEAPLGGGFEGRSSEDRARLAALRGGSPASERAVERGLAWLASHQRQDGSWLLDHRAGPCNGRCAKPGQIETPIGATGLALLPFLGAGYTHLQGKYQHTVSNGLAFLQSKMTKTPHGGDLQWDTEVGMYAQGIATLALCEAYAMTGDAGLRPSAEEAVRFICHAQNAAGGWRYKPQQPGDTTITGWQVMALKSAQLSGLSVPPSVNARAQRFLNTMQDAGGAFYGYASRGKQPGPTAVGLLLRMYSGWTRQDERLGRGVAYLAYHGPSQNDMYFNYYATQVLHHFEGNYWPEWNRELRDYLVTTQANDGHELGSWFFNDSHGVKGGRHYTTAICTMILEVYYRYMPLYGKRAVEKWD